MKRKDFLKGIGLAKNRMTIPPTRYAVYPKRVGNDGGECVLIPSETAGPFALDLTDNQEFFRKDIRESETGVQLNLKMRIVGLENCEPMPNVRVHIWQCDRNGVYSGYQTGNNPGDPDATHLRGYQITDANGDVEFITIFPSYYPGRICHIHFQVYVSSSYSAVSQFTFPINQKNQLYNENVDLYPKGADPLTFEQDFSFHDGHHLQLATLEKDSETGIYHSFLEVTVKGSGLTGVGYLESESAKVFDLGQNYPNPYSKDTSIPVLLKQPAFIKIELWNLMGKKVATIFEEKRASGNFNVSVNFANLGLAPANYVYQLEARNENGVYRLAKLMTYAP